MSTQTITSAFAKYQAQAWPYQYDATMHIHTIAGGIPSDPKKAEGWIKSKMATADDLLLGQVAETMAERGITADEAAAVVDSLKHLNGFKRDGARGGELYIEGRQLKAAIKEAASVAGAAGKLPLKSWGRTNKGLLGFVAEHICVVEDRLHLGVTEPTGVNQRFVHTFRGSGIQYEEYVENATINFTIMSDHEFPLEQWAMIWETGGQQGLGATRSQGYGRYTVTRWEKRP